MVKEINGGLPGLAKFVAIFTIKFIRIFFQFQGLPESDRRSDEGKRL